MRWWMNPFNLYRVVRDARRVAGGGGPVAVRLCGVEHPKGWVFPASAVSLEVEGKDGRVTPIEAPLPVPFAFAWGYRIARKLGVPFVKDIEPEHLSTEVKVPGR